MASLESTVESMDLAVEGIKKKKRVSNMEKAAIEKDKFMIEFVDAYLWAYNFGFDECISTIERL